MDEKLEALHRDWQRRPFQWGTADCTCFARDAAWRLHGLAIEVPTYATEREAVRLLADHFKGLHRALVMAGFELADRAPVRGDLIVYEGDFPGLFSRGLAVSFGGDLAFAPSEFGLLSVAPELRLQVWRPKGGA
jgi:hypothetical protein